MNSSNTFELLTEGYRLLCEIEYRIREIIERINSRKYGFTWINYVTPSINLNNATYFDLICHISRNPLFKSMLNEVDLTKLYDLNRVRNKICHLRDLKYSEILMKNKRTLLEVSFRCILTRRNNLA